MVQISIPTLILGHLINGKINKINNYALLLVCIQSSWQCALYYI